MSIHCLQLDVFVLTGEPTYHLRIHVKKGYGVLLQLTKALDALDFEIVNANLTTISDRFINTIVMKVNVFYFLCLCCTLSFMGMRRQEPIFVCRRRYDVVYKF